MDRTDEPAKLFLTKNQVFADLVDFALRHSGFKVDRQSLQDRNPEGIIQCPWNSLKYKVCDNDLLKGLVVKHSDKATWMLVATEHQSYVSNTMPLRNLITAAAHWDGIRRSLEDEHRKLHDLRGDDFLSGMARKDRLPPLLVFVLYYGLEPWNGPMRLSDIIDCPPELKPFMADCPTNVISPRELKPVELEEINVGALRAVFKAICYSRSPADFCHEIKTDPSFHDLSTEDFDFMRMTSGIDLKPKHKENNNMQDTMEIFANYFKEDWFQKGIQKGEQSGFQKGEQSGFQKGEQSGFFKAISHFIQKRINCNISEKQIIEDLSSEFGLTSDQARQYLNETKGNSPSSDCTGTLN
ncbi:MAG: Rpn family recombination-promoting nuclease/putative transposase [Victivallales bacterium]|nr:Rpn family recombination-promoting nuclease/putative transposase [Victivallales bacterium]